MKKFSILFLLFSVLISAQNNRMIYEYTFRPDSTKVDSLKTEWMYLDISKNGSKYYSKSTFESDSIVNESIKKQMAAGMKSISVSRNQRGGEVSYEVEKSYPDYKTNLISRVGNDSYKVLEDRKLDWKILPKKIKSVNSIHKKQQQILQAENGRPGLSTKFQFSMDLTNFHDFPD